MEFKVGDKVIVTITDKMKLINAGSGMFVKDNDRTNGIWIVTRVPQPLNRYIDIKSNDGYDARYSIGVIKTFHYEISKYELIPDDLFEI